MENPPFEDVFPIQDRDFPLLCLFTGGWMPDFSIALSQEDQPHPPGIHVSLQGARENSDGFSVALAFGDFFQPGAHEVDC